MKTYIITYEINETADNIYRGLYAEIKKSKKWWHYIANSWLITTDEDANQIFNRLKTHLDSNVNLLIIELGKDRQGWLPDKAWEWIRKNLPQ